MSPVALPFALTPGADARSRWQSTFESLVQEGKRNPDRVGGLLRASLRAGSPLDERTLATQIGNIFLGGLAPLTSGIIGRGRDGPSPPSARAAPRTDPSERSYRTGLPPRVLA